MTRRTKAMTTLAAMCLSVTTATAAPAEAHHSRTCERARSAVIAAGGRGWEVDFATTIAYRESRCQLRAHNWSTRTRDDSWGPWQINYYGSLRSYRTRLLGPPSTNTQSWDRAARNFLKLLRRHGACHWQPPRYCS